jgi:hypothetical protein
MNSSAHIYDIIDLDEKIIEQDCTN